MANEPAAALVVEGVLRTLGDPDRLAGVLEEILAEIDRVVAARKPDERLYVTCTTVYEEWRPSGDAFTALGKTRELSMYGKDRYVSEIPTETGRTMTPPFLGFYWLVRKRIDETGSVVR